MQIQEIENRANVQGQSNGGGMSEYQQFASTMNVQINNHKKGTKMFSKDNMNLRRNSQEKLYNNGSMIQNNSINYCP